MKQQSLANPYVWQWPQSLGDRLPAARWLAQLPCSQMCRCYSQSVQSADCCNYLQPNVKNINAITGHLPGFLLHVTCEERLPRTMCRPDSAVTGWSLQRCGHKVFISEIKNDERRRRQHDPPSVRLHESREGRREVSEWSESCSHPLNHNFKYAHRASSTLSRSSVMS